MTDPCLGRGLGLCIYLSHCPPPPSFLEVRGLLAVLLLEHACTCHSPPPGGGRLHGDAGEVQCSGVLMSVTNGVRHVPISHLTATQCVDPCVDLEVCTSFR